jgi:hypothetical protein
MLEIIKATPARPLVTSVFIPFTREWAVRDFLKMLGDIEFGVRSSVELVFYNDTADPELQNVLSKWLIENCGEFAGAKLYQSNNQRLPEVGDVHLATMRRERIVEMKKKSKELIGDSFFVFCLEDDTFVAPDAYMRLYSHMKNTKVGIASGVEMGRWAYPMIGAWNITPLNDPIKVETVPYRTGGVQRVTSPGWYCYMTKTNLYKKADYRFEAECLGPDVCYGWDVSKLGQEALIDWDVKCDHRQPDGSSIWPGDGARVLTYERDAVGAWAVNFNFKVHSA